MKLEAKLGSTYGILILAMLATSTVAYLRMSEVNRITGKFITEQVPLVYSNRGARVSLGKSIACWKSGCSTVGTRPQRKIPRTVPLQRADTDNGIWRNCAIWTSRFDLGEDNARIRSFERRRRSCTNSRTILRT